MGKKRPLRSTISKKNLLYRGVPKEFINATIDEYPIDEDKRELFINYAKHLDVMLDDRMDLVLYGSNGSGKTYLTSILVKECYRRRYTAFRTTLENYLQLQFKTNNEEYADKLKKIEHCEFLVLDEVGKETQTKNNWNIVKLEELIRNRNAEGLPTIMCMNLPLEGAGGFYEQYGKSLTSLVEGNFIKILFEGEDNRHGVSVRRKGVSVLFGEEV